jgi:hypothetical protein
MAQAEEIIEDDNEHQEAEELEMLLANTEDEDSEAIEGDEHTTGKGGILSLGKKTWVLIGSGIFLTLLLAGGAYFFLFSSEQSPDGDLNTGEQAENGASIPPPVETVKGSFSKVHVFPLEPFFLPLKMNDRETGNFI